MKSCPTSVKINSMCRGNFDVTGQLLVIYSVFIKYLIKNGNTMRLCITYLQTSRKPVII